LENNEVIKPAYLVLEDGTVFKGRFMGLTGETIGEVVFNTCTASYQDILCDPTYFGQIVAQTYPLVGNRGVEHNRLSSVVAANGYIAREWCEKPTDMGEGLTIDAYLKKKRIVGICGIDTRQLTRKIRDKGYFKGAITDSLQNTADLLTRINAYSIHGAVSEVTSGEIMKFSSCKNVYTLVVFDYGANRVVLNSLLKRGCDLVVVPAGMQPGEISRYNPDGLVFPDGPGDPDDNPSLIDNMKNFLTMGLPFYGYGLGHQMIALALGGQIKKMDNGHRGSNQPVIICGTDKIMITTQNHGYDIADGSLSTDIAAITMRNINDNSIEGVFYSSINGISTQFAPVEVGNYSDTSWIFDAFISLLKGERTNG
jgi:carbamoyl-phosphate synthase small subunit